MLKLKGRHLRLSVLLQFPLKIRGHMSTITLYYDWVLPVIITKFSTTVLVTTEAFEYLLSTVTSIMGGAI